MRKLPSSPVQLAAPAAAATIAASIDQRATMRHASALLLGLVCCSATAGAQDLRRATVWDLKLGQPPSAQPSPDEFHGFACGANGGPPRPELSGGGGFSPVAAPARAPPARYF